MNQTTKPDQVRAAAEQAAAAQAALDTAKARLADRERHVEAIRARLAELKREREALLLPSADGDRKATKRSDDLRGQVMSAQLDLEDAEVIVRQSRAMVAAAEVDVRRTARRVALAELAAINERRLAEAVKVDAALAALREAGTASVDLGREAYAVASRMNGGRAPSWLLPNRRLAGAVQTVLAQLVGLDVMPMPDRAFRAGFGEMERRVITRGVVFDHSGPAEGMEADEPGASVPEEPEGVEVSDADVA